MFQRSCDEYAKLFVPEPRQDQIIDSLISYYGRYYSIDILDECIDAYVKDADEPILVYDFAMASSKIRDKIVERKKSKEAFDLLVKQTEERMREFDEL